MDIHCIRQHKVKLLAVALFLGFIHPAVAQNKVISWSNVESAIQETSFTASFLPQVRSYGYLVLTITGYSSTPDQTDDTPFTTALGTHVRDGVIAANFLPFGTRLVIPELFGDKVFTVEDRMHERFNRRLDIWFPDRKSAQIFGVRNAEVIIVGGPALTLR